MLINEKLTKLNFVLHLTGLTGSYGFERFFRFPDETGKGLSHRSGESEHNAGLVVHARPGSASALAPDPLFLK